MNLYLSYSTLFGGALWLLGTVACRTTDTTKIIQPTDHQISTVSLSLSREVVATNMAAQSVSDNEDYTLVGAVLRKGGQTLVGLWLFNQADSSFVKSVNQEALNNSPFPAWAHPTPPFGSRQPDCFPHTLADPPLYQKLKNY